jgi:hypothetical protein
MSSHAPRRIAMSNSVVVNQEEQATGRRRAPFPFVRRPTPRAWIRLAEGGIEPDWDVCRTNPARALETLQQAVRKTEGATRLRLACWMMVLVIARQDAAHARSTKP